MNNLHSDIREQLREGDSSESGLDAKLSQAVKESAARISSRVAKAMADKLKRRKLPLSA